MIIKENARAKKLLSDTYNYIFNKLNGNFIRWGKTLKDDPPYSPYGPEILDIEVSTKCAGPGGKPCSFCYKSNGPSGKNMSIATFKKILDKMPRSLTQCAFGADAQCTSNPDIWKMMDYCRNHKTNPIVPNITVADISPKTADKLAKVCGAVAVSRYTDKDLCYNSVRLLLDRGLKQTNIHIMVSEETLSMVKETLEDYKKDPRLSGLNAIVLLSLKKKGRGTKYTPLSQDKFTELVNYALSNDIPIGFDSCSCGKFFNAVKGKPGEKVYRILAEPCEGFGIFSSYISVDGKFYPCSFCEQAHDDFKEGIDVLKVDSFLDDVWNNTITDKWRNIMLARRKEENYECPIYKV